MHKTFCTSLLFFITLSSVVYTNLTVKQHGHKPFVPMTLFAERDDILILQNELNVMENRLAEQAQLLVSAFDEGNIIFANELAKDHNLNLQKFFQLNSALVKVYEVKLKLLNVSEGVAITDLQQQQIEKEIKEMEEMCELGMKKDGGAQDVFDSKVFDDLLSNFNDKCPLLHSILQTLLVTDQRKRVYKSPEYKLTCGIHALSLLLSVRNKKCKNGVRLLLGLVCVTFGAGKQLMNLLNHIGLTPHWDTMYVHICVYYICLSFKFSGEIRCGIEQNKS